MRNLTLPIVLASLALCSFATQDGSRDKTDWAKLEPQVAREKVAKTFKRSCASCHLPPDPSFATDRAWISQLMDTA